MRFATGHGTENDFVLVPDAEGALDLTPRLVAALCDRRAGLGGDGVLRVVRAAAHPDAAEQAGEAEWFMDYRNSDGSVAEMCGNGLRVFARYLVAEGLVPPAPFAVATRGGVKAVRFADGGHVVVDLGPAALPATLADVTVRVGDAAWPARGVLIPNPHAVAMLADGGGAGGDGVELAALDLSTPPRVEPAGAYPDGVNVEIVADRGPAHVAMRVHERGSGETSSCGTGVGAAAVAARRRAGLDVVDDDRRNWTVDVPGGRLAVTERADGHVELAGPAVLVARGELTPEWLEASR